MRKRFHSGDRRPPVALQVLLLGLAAGCVAPESQAAEAAAETASIASGLVMESIQTERDAGHLRVSFELVNQRSRAHGFEWTILWLDARGVELGSRQPWSVLRLDASGRESLSARAPDREASGFRLGLRALR